MVNDPLKSVYSIVERTYIRLQAGDILIRCLEEKSSEPIHEMVEGLVLAGPNSLDAMREILLELLNRKSEIKDEISQIINELRNVLLSYGVKINQIQGSKSLFEIKPTEFFKLIKQQGVDEDQNQMDCLQIFQNSRELIINLNVQLNILEEVEMYIRDWTWSIAYKQIQGLQDSETPNNPDRIL